MKLCLLSADQLSRTRLRSDLVAALSGVTDAQVVEGHDKSPHADVIVVDAMTSQALSGLDQAIAGLSRDRQIILLAVAEGSPMPVALVDGRVDDVLVYPFRPLEVMSKLMHFEQLLLWHEVRRINQSFSQTLETLKLDVELASRLQKSKLPKRFSQVKGFTVGHRYLAGIKSGGDHFDLAESRDGSSLSLVLTDSSSHGLSGSVLSVLMKVALKLSSSESRSALATVKTIADELMLTLGEKDRLSIFYGVISRKDYSLKYVNLGGGAAFLAHDSGTFEALDAHGSPLERAAGLASGLTESSQKLEAQDRLVLLSDGFIDAAGGISGTLKVLNEHRKLEAADTLNALGYLVKSRLDSEDEMPAQDCTATVFDVDGRLIKLVN